jgi:hypothetical protein
MCRVRTISLLITLLFCECSVLRGQESIKSSPTPSPVESKAPLTKEEITIYRDVLYRHVSKWKPTNVSRLTFPLDAGSDILRDCLPVIDLGAIGTPSYHRLGSEVLARKNMRLVDPAMQAEIINRNDPSKTMKNGKPVSAAVDDAFATGMVLLSEIVFDRGRLYAVVESTFRCGIVCGNGRTEVYKKVDEAWKFDRVCSSAIY